MCVAEARLDFDKMDGSEACPGIENDEVELSDVAVEISAKDLETALTEEP